jgi:hypothetical protein
MGVVIDKALGRELIHEHPVTLSATEPATTKEGLLYFNTTDSTLYIYYGGAWIAIGSGTTVDGVYLAENDDYFITEADDYLATE